MHFDHPNNLLSHRDIRNHLRLRAKIEQIFFLKLMTIYQKYNVSFNFLSVSLFGFRFFFFLFRRFFVPLFVIFGAIFLPHKPLPHSIEWKSNHFKRLSTQNYSIMDGILWSKHRLHGNIKYIRLNVEEAWNSKQRYTR